MRRARVAALSVLAVVPIVVIPVGAAAPASAGENWQDGNLQLLTSTLPAMLPGQSGWAGISWTADTDVCDVQITATAPGMTLGYPSTTTTYTSLYVNDALAATNRDYAALHLSVPATASAPLEVTLTATFSRLPPGQIKKDDDLVVVEPDCSKGRPGGSVTTTVTLPVARPTGAEATLQTTTASVTRGTPAWVPLTFTTDHAGLADFRVRVTPPDGLEVVYPGDGTSSGLAEQATLPVGRADSAAVRFDASGLEPGSYEVPVTATWSGGSLSSTLRLTVR